MVVLYLNKYIYLNISVGILQRKHIPNRSARERCNLVQFAGSLKASKSESPSSVHPLTSVHLCSKGEIHDVRLERTDGQDAVVEPYDKCGPKGASQR